jgi:hypothetical protein
MNITDSQDARRRSERSQSSAKVKLRLVQSGKGESEASLKLTGIEAVL